MSVQRLGAKKIRRLAQVTGLDVTRAWANGGYTYEFATRDHRHGRYDMKTGEWWMAEGDGPFVHLSSCYSQGALLAELEPQVALAGAP